MSENTYFGFLDFRNAKFQGSIRDGDMDGIGIILDHYYLFALTNWKGSQPYGPTLVVFPNRDYFYGKIKNKKMSQICCLVKSSGQTLFFNFVNGVADSIAYIDNNQTVIEMVNTNGRLHVQKTHSLKDKQGARWQIIGNILKSQIPEEMRNYYSYVKNVIEKQFYDVVECSTNANINFIGFKKTSSLGVKIQGKGGQIKCIGRFQQFPRNIEFGRKFTCYSRAEVRIEEGKFGQNQRFYQFKNKQRPSEAAKFNQQFFKRGTNFKNTFLKFTVFQQIYNYFAKVQSEISHLTILQFGQKIIQGHESNYESQKQALYHNKVYDLDQVRQQIYAAINRRNNGRKTITDRQSSPLQILKKSRQKLTTNLYEPEDRMIIYQQKTNSPRSKSKYKYTEEIKAHQAKDLANTYTEKKRKEFQIYPEVSQFQRRIQRKRYEVTFNRPLSPRNDQNIPRKSPQKVFRNIEREKQLYLFDRNVQLSAGRDYLQEEIIPTSKRNNLRPFAEPAKTPLKYRNSIYIKKEQNQLSSVNQELDNVSKDSNAYENYLKYKNRNKPIERSISSNKVYTETNQPMQKHKKYQIYQRKVLGPRNITPDKESTLIKLQRVPEDAANSGSRQERTFVGTGRHKKNFKYL